MDSGVSIFNLSKVGFGEAWGLETGDSKTREILHFTPFLLHSLTEETGYKRPELFLFEGLVTCRSLFSYCAEDYERVYFDRVQNPVNL